MPSTPEWLRKAQESWSFRGQQRPSFAVEPGPGQESVWDYPRPPAIVPDQRTVVVKHGHTILAESIATVRICETASPPTFYIPPKDVNLSLLSSVAGSSFCEWKGAARYWQFNSAAQSGASALQTVSIGWDYPEPLPAFQEITGYFSFYPARVHCTIDGERVQAQSGGFYGGWITADVKGPFKGDPGTGGW